MPHSPCECARVPVSLHLCTLEFRLVICENFPPPRFDRLFALGEWCTCSCLKCRRSLLRTAELYLSWPQTPTLHTNQAQEASRVQVSGRSFPSARPEKEEWDGRAMQSLLRCIRFLVTQNEMVKAATMGIGLSLLVCFIVLLLLGCKVQRRTPSITMKLHDMLASSPRPIPLALRLGTFVLTSSQI